MKIDVKKISRLANLKIEKSEEKLLENQLNSILSYIEKLEELDTSGVTETSQVTGLENVLREDKTAPSLSTEEALSETEKKHNQLFKTKAIFE